MPGNASPVTPEVAKLSCKNTFCNMVAMMIDRFIRMEPDWNELKAQVIALHGFWIILNLLQTSVIAALTMQVCTEEWHHIAPLSLNI